MSLGIPPLRRTSPPVVERLPAPAGAVQGARVSDRVDGLAAQPAPANVLLFCHPAILRSLLSASYLCDGDASIPSITRTSWTRSSASSPGRHVANRPREKARICSVEAQ